MKLSKVFKTGMDSCRALLRYPAASWHELSHVPAIARAAKFVNSWEQHSTDETAGSQSPEHEGAEPTNPLRQYFEGVSEGPGIWKWLHYFNVYHQHLQKFVGREISLVEVGVYSGGSMPMWREYFGQGCQVHGIDIQEECKAYENDHTTIHIGDQADRRFWGQFRKAVPQVDVLIDDGGHTPEQQMVTLEEMLPHLRPGGVFICEDIHGLGNEFTSFIYSLVNNLNAENRTSDKTKVVYQSTPFQSAIRSINLYPFLVVIEKFDVPSQYLSAPKHGTQWQPFLSQKIESRPA